MTVAARKVAIFYTDHPNEWSRDDGTFATMAVELLEQAKEHEPYVGAEGGIEYRVFDVYNGELPSVDELSSGDYLGLYITGSRYDSFDTETQWIVDLRKLLYRLVNETTLPIVGICFGHQVLARSLGAQVGRNPKGLEAGVHGVQLNATGKTLFSRDRLYLSELHSDHVEEVPPGYENWGHTEKSHCQGLYKPQRVLTFQGHPEFTTQLAIKSTQHKHQTGQLSDEEYAETIQRCHSNNDDVHAARNIWKLYHGKI